MHEALIAPCGMNCGLCTRYLAMRNDVQSKGVKISYCSGCRPRDRKCAFVQKDCALLRKRQVKFCYECPDFPCEKLQKLDATYSRRYRMSMIENQQYIRDYGMEKFLENEEQKWKCPDCGSVICCHNGLCYNCRADELKNTKDKNRWKQ
jgi:hypothetical protein